MKAVPTYTLLEWYQHPLTHPVVVASCRAELIRRDELPQRGRQLGCGCCVGPEDDRCCCHMHCDIPRGLVPHKCSLHA